MRQVEQHCYASKRDYPFGKSLSLSFTVLNLWSFLPFSQQDESHKLLTYSGFHSITDEVPRFSQCPHLCSALSMLRHQDVSHAVITI